MSKSISDSTYWLFLAVIMTGFCTGTETEHPYAVLRQSRPSYDRSNGLFQTKVWIENTSTTESIPKPVVCIVSDVIPSEVSVVPDGYLDDGRPYVEFSSVIDGDSLGPNSKSAQKKMRFQNPGRRRFTFTSSVVSGPQQPSWTVSTQGGTFTSTFGLKLEIAADSLAEDHTVTVNTLQAPALPDDECYVFASRLSSLSVMHNGASGELSERAQLTIPFDASSLPPGTPDEAVFLMAKISDGNDLSRLPTSAIAEIDSANDTITTWITSSEDVIVAAYKPISIEGQTFSSLECKHYDTAIDYMKALDIEENAAFMESLINEMELDDEFRGTVLKYGYSVQALSENTVVFESITGIKAAVYMRHGETLGDLLTRSNIRSEEFLELAHTIDEFHILTEHLNHIADGYGDIANPIGDIASPDALAMYMVKIMYWYGVALVDQAQICAERGQLREEFLAVQAYFDLRETGRVRCFYPRDIYYGKDCPEIVLEGFRASVKGAKDQSDSGQVLFNILENNGGRNTALQPCGDEPPPDRLPGLEDIPYFLLLQIPDTGAFDKAPFYWLGDWIDYYNVEYIVIVYDFGDGIPTFRVVANVPSQPALIELKYFDVVPLRSLPEHVDIRIYCFAQSRMNPFDRIRHYDTCPTISMDIEPPNDEKIIHLGKFRAEDLNNDDQVVGLTNEWNSQRDVLELKYWLWEKGGMTLLDSVDVEPKGSYNSIHISEDSKVTMGLSTYVKLLDLDSGTTQRICMPGYQQTQTKTVVTDVFRYNIVVGYCYDAPGHEEDRAFVKYSKFNNYAWLDGWPESPAESVARAVSNAGIAGYYRQEGSTFKPFFVEWNGDQLGPIVDLGPVYMRAGFVFGMNNLGDMVGHAHWGTPDRHHAVTWEPGGHMRPLPTFKAEEWDSSCAVDINNKGLIIGWATKGNEYAKPCLWQGNEIIHLNEWLSNPDWEIEHVSSINDKGHIVGYGRYKGEDDHAFMLKW